MSSPIVRMIREEIWSSKIQSIQGFRLEDIIRGLESSLQAGLNIGGEERDFLLGLLKRVVEDARFLAEFRVMKASMGAEIPGDSFDKSILELVGRLKEFLALLYSGSLVVQNNRVTVYATRACEGLEKGDVALVTVEDAVLYYLRACVTLVTRPIYTYVMSLKKAGTGS
uniref:Uncharacterized protein n=1 Tax=Thermogladius calderae TaxID=1200300 RepID=A0A7J3XYI6_9CREN